MARYPRTLREVLRGGRYVDAVPVAALTEREAWVEAAYLRRAWVLGYRLDRMRLARRLDAVLELHPRIARLVVGPRWDRFR